MIDPITLSVIQNGLQQVCNEMDLAFCRSAFSPVISEAMDRSDGIYARDDGALIAQGELGLPPHAVAEVAVATRVFHRVLEAATPEGVDIRGDDAPPGVEAAVAVLSEELFSTTSSPTVRPVVEAAVMGLSKRSGLDVNKVLDVKPAHAQALLARPLRSKHVNVQTQVVHIVNFCLSARPAPIMSVNAQTVGLLQEALVVAENDDPNTFKGGPGAADSLHALRAA